MKSKLLGLIFFAGILYFGSGACFVKPAAQGEVESFINQACLSTVFVANECNYYDAAFGPERYTFLGYVRWAYEWKWPTEHSHGTGFLISADGYILTTEHVIDGATSLLVVLENPDLRVCKARVIGSDKRTDIAVLKLEGTGGVKLPFLKFGNSNAIKLGDDILAIGNPDNVDLVFESTVTQGVISGTDRIASWSNPISGHIQIDAPINTGNSGSPVLNCKGEMIGMNITRLDPKYGHLGISFAIPSNTIKLISDQLISKGRVSQGCLGVELKWTQESVFDTYYFDRNDGAIIMEVIPGTPAENAGLRPGDRVTKLNEIDIPSARSLRNEIWIRPPNTMIKLTIERNGAVSKINVKTGSEELAKKFYLKGTEI